MWSFLLRLWTLLLLWNWTKGDEANSQVTHSVNFKLPPIDFEDEEMVVSSGETLHLHCKSNNPIKWTTPKYKTVDEEKLVNISGNFTIASNSDFPYVSHLEVSHLNVMDTGYYYCRFQDNTDLNAEEEVASVYVYVNDSDELLVTNESFIHLTPIQYQEVTIPCKPSSPDVNVTLSKDDEIVFPSADSFVEYNPKLGYVISSVNINAGGFYTCMGKRGEIETTLSISVKVLPHTNAVPKPRIEYKNTGHVVVGSDLHLECTVQMDLSVIFNLEWSTPNQIANESGRLHIGDAVSRKVQLNNLQYTQGSKHLIVQNVTSDDEGYYNCTVVDHTHKTNRAEKRVRVFEANITYINFTVQGNVPEITVKAGKKRVQWVVHVAAHPYPELSWYGPRKDGTDEIHNSTKYEIQFEPSQTTLKVSAIEMSDAGHYQLKGNNGKVEKTLNLTLIVEDAPAVEVNGQMYYMYGKVHQVNCSVVGFPIPNVTWYFKSCKTSYQNCDEEYALLDKRYYQEISLNGKGEKISTLQIKADESGYLTCLACNSVDCENETINFFVTDIINGFDAYVLPSEPVVGDNVTLSCGASVYNYTNSITWYKYNPENPENHEPLTNRMGYKVIPTTSKFSRKVDIKIDNIDMIHAGIYICKAKKISDEPNEEEINVTVKKIQKPVFVNSSMNGSYYYIDPGAKVEWKCNAIGVPKPSVIWYKDGKLLKVEQKMELSNDNQTLKIAHVNVKDEGKYTCKVLNKGGTIEGSLTLELNDERALNNGVLIGSLIFGAILTVLVVLLIVKNQNEKKKRKKLQFANFEEGALENINPELGVDDQAELLPYDKKWEFPREKLKLGKQLGSGAFGIVMKADAYGIIEGEALTTVAVKMVKRNAEYTHIKALASELKIMVHLGKHLNVVNLLGACTKNLTKRELLVIVEYCRFGNLQNYLLRHREDFIDQIDPLTGKVVPERGLELEMHSDTSTYEAREAIKPDPRIKYAALSFSTSASSVGSQGSVQDYRAAPLVNVSSTPCNGTTGQTVNTDMSVVSMSPSGEECGVTGGSSSEPDWRTNYRGDYGRRDVRPICTSDLICWAFQVARGIDYLASRRVLHGDVAARNILLAEDNVVKICDFGLAKSMYKSDNYKKKGDGPLPVKWMAIESIRDRVFSTQSDIWSFGIVLWEFFSLARTPYPGMEADEKLYNKLIAGYRMEKPQYATDEIYSVMLDCWKGQPSERPTFADLTEKLGGMLEDAVKRHYIDLNSPYIMMNNQQQESTDYLGMMSEPSYANAMREMTPQREYVNMPTQPENPALDYMTMSSPVPPSEDGAESESGYLCMRSGSMGNEGNPTVIFSPRPNPTQTFDFELPSPRNASRLSPKLRALETKGAEVPELSPMLPLCTHYKDLTLQKEDSLDSGVGSPSSYFNPTYRSLPNKNGHIPPNGEISETNYVNIPQTMARQSDRSSGFQSDAGEMSPLPGKNTSFDIPLEMLT